MADVGLDLVAAVLAMTPDAAKAQVMAEIQAAVKEVADAKADLQKQREDFAAEREQARQDRMAAEAAQADVGQREAAWTQANDGLASAQKSHAAEVEAFGKMREKIDADHQAREQRLTDWESNARDTNAMMEQHKVDLDEREAAVSAREEAVSRKHEALTAAMAA